MEQMRRNEAFADRRIDRGGLPVPPGIRLISLLREGLRGSTPSRARKRAADESRAGPVRRRMQDIGAARSPMDAGITGGMSLLNGPWARRS